MKQLTDYLDRITKEENDTTCEVMPEVKVIFEMQEVLEEYQDVFVPKNLSVFEDKKTFATFPLQEANTRFKEVVGRMRTQERWVVGRSVWQVHHIVKIKSEL